MEEPPRRPILRLKNPPANLPKPPGLEPPKKPEPKAAEPAGPRWKCKPCGTAVVLPAEGDDLDVVRCVSCNARLGKLGDFRAGAEGQVRARKVG